MPRLLPSLLLLTSLSLLSPAFAAGDITYALISGQVWKKSAKECSFLKWEKYDGQTPNETLSFPNIRLTFGKVEAGAVNVSLEKNDSSDSPAGENPPAAFFISLYDKTDKNSMSLDAFKAFYESVRTDMDATLGEKGRIYNNDKNMLFWKSAGSDIILSLGLSQTDKGMEASYLHIIAAPPGKITGALKQLEKKS